MTLFLTRSVDAPVIWVGPIVLATLAALILVRPRRWTVGLGIGFSLFVLVGAFIAPGLFDRLSDPTAASAFFGTAIQIAGLVIALAAGAAALSRVTPVPRDPQRIGVSGQMRDRVPHARRRWLLIAVVVSFAAVLALVIGLRQPAPVGHFTSAEAKDRFVTAYATAMADLPRPERTLDLRTNFGVVRVYRFSGADPAAAPLVLLPGRASASPVWADNLPALLKQRSAYALDLLGEPGLSIQDHPITSDADQAQWLSEVLAQLPEPRLHLLGVSIGGWTAINLVIHADAKIASVTLLDPVFVFAPMSTEAILRSIPASVRWFPKAWRDDFASWTAGGAPVEDVPLAQLIETGFQTYALKLPAPTQPSEHTLATVECPVLVIMAGQSPMHDSAAAADTARRTLAKRTVLTYTNASHAINGEYPDQIAADLGAFLAGVG